MTLLRLIDRSPHDSSLTHVNDLAIMGFRQPKKLAWDSCATQVMEVGCRHFNAHGKFVVMPHYIIFVVHILGAQNIIGANQPSISCIRDRFPSLFQNVVLGSLYFSL